MIDPLPQPTREEAHNARPPVADDDHPPLEEQIRAWLRKDGKTPGYYGADSVAQRTARAERALVALAALEFGEGPGHPFRGNQWKDGEGGGWTAETRPDHARRALARGEVHTLVRSVSGWKVQNNVDGSVSIHPNKVRALQALKAARTGGDKQNVTERWRSIAEQEHEANIADKLKTLRDARPEHRVDARTADQFTRFGWVKAEKNGYGPARWALTPKGEDRLRQAQLRSR